MLKRWMTAEPTNGPAGARSGTSYQALLIFLLISKNTIESKIMLRAA